MLLGRRVEQQLETGGWDRCDRCGLPWQDGPSTSHRISAARTRPSLPVSWSLQFCVVLWHKVVSQIF